MCGLLYFVVLCINVDVVSLFADLSFLSLVNLHCIDVLYQFKIMNIIYFLSKKKVRRVYILKGLMQPNLPSFRRTQFGSTARAFLNQITSIYGLNTVNSRMQLIVSIAFSFSNLGGPSNLVLKSSPKANLKIGSKHLRLKRSYR